MPKTPYLSLYFETIVYVLSRVDLPEKYLKQKVAMQINEPGDIESIRVDERILAALDVDEKHRLQKARSSELLLAKFVDIIPLEELEARKQEENEKNRVTVYKRFTQNQIISFLLCYCNSSS